MESRPSVRRIVVLACLALVSSACQPTGRAFAEGPKAFAGKKSAWHGFDRYDFLLDEEKLTAEPIVAGAGEGNGVGGAARGKRRCIVVVPKKAAAGNPWSWRGCYWDHEPGAEIALLKRGFHVAFVGGDPGKPWDAWYAILTGEYGLSKKPNFIGMSRGGLNAYTWSTANPEKVSCLYVDNPAVSPASLTKLSGLARNDVPLFHVCGSLDPLLGRHTLAVEGIYRALGGRISVMIKDGAGHHPHGLRDPQPVVDFIVRSQEPAKGERPALLGRASTKSSYYSVEESYRDFPSERTRITCRGPAFVASYDRYETKVLGVRPAVVVIVPKTAAAGKPWVFRADLVSRDAAVDQLLLAKGFHIVTGPVPYDADGPALKDWNAVYEYLVGHGFSKRPVLEGSGGAAGDAFAWAIANPGKVSCIYCENPILRSKMSKGSPLDSLSPLAKAGVPLYHACGSLDPWLKGQTRIAQDRYEKLGGKITVVVEEGKGHYPLAPKDRQAAADFIVETVNRPQSR